MKSTRFLTLICAAALTSGCASNLPTGPLFCDVESVRTFTPAELDARAPFPENLRRDLATNERGARWCGWGQAG
jgi:hypothetical protein